MGLEGNCKATFKGKTCEGKARLETDVLQFRSADLKLSIPLGEIRNVTACRGTLAISSRQGTASFELGAAAAKWAVKIQHPLGRNLSRRDEGGRARAARQAQGVAEAGRRALGGAPKGRREITERDVMAAGKAAGLVDVKVVSFSPTHTAEKFVIPVKDRERFR